MTCREKLAKEHPDYIDSCYITGCRGCPYKYGYLDAPEWCPVKHKIGPTETSCSKCWDREMPEDNNLKGENDMTSKTKKELIEELTKAKENVEKLKEALVKVENRKKYDEAALETKAMYDSFINAGFTEAQAFSIIMTMISTCGKLPKK